MALAAAAPAQNDPTHDVLTGAHTSQSLLNEGRKHFSYSQRHGSPLSVMAFRVDSYAQTTQEAGKEISDQLLARIAKMIMGMLRAEDSFGRVAEATFVVVSAGSSSAQVLAFARRLHAQLDTAQVRNGKQVLKIRTSFGLASAGAAPAASIEDLMKLAMQRLQVAGARPSDPIVGDEPAASQPSLQPSAQRAAQPIAAAVAPTDVERALQLLERADPVRLDEEAVRRLLPVLDKAFARMQLRFPMEAVLKVLDSSHAKEKVAA